MCEDSRMSTENREQALGLYLETKWLPVEQLADLAAEVQARIDGSGFGTARKFFAAQADPIERRWLAADALAAAGWTNEIVRWRKS
jgi:hypothetical protein